MRYFLFCLAWVSTLAAFGQRTLNIKVVNLETRRPLKVFFHVNTAPRAASITEGGYYQLKVNPSDTIEISAPTYPLKRIPVPPEDSVVVALDQSNSDGLGIFGVVDETATFPGGIAKFYEYAGKNLKYPDEAKKDSVSGRVFVEFVINSDGKIDPRSIKVLKGIHPACDEEAMRIVRESVPWIPGKIKGKPVRQKFVLPFAFRF